jgi:hypothetical protein
MKGKVQPHCDEVGTANDFWRELLGLRADLRALDVMLLDLSVRLIVRVSIIAFARRQKKIHHVQAEPEVASTGLLVQQSLSGHAADIAPFVDAGFELVGLD